MTTARFRSSRWFDCCCRRRKIVLWKINNFISVQGCRCKLPKTFIIIAQFKPFLLCFIRNRIHFHFQFFWCFCSCSSFVVASIFVNCLLSNARGMRNYSRWASVELLLSSRDSISSLCTFFPSLFICESMHGTRIETTTEYREWLLPGYTAPHRVYPATLPKNAFLASHSVECGNFDESVVCARAADAVNFSSVFAWKFFFPLGWSD